MSAYYNEFDPKKAEWLRELIRAGLIADGEVDERSIADVAGDDLAGFTQCHFFAGIGAWSYALRQAGWSDDRQVWTTSCPCQSFSSAGKQKGFDDKRHLWPECHRLIGERRPGVVFGEQVSNHQVVGAVSKPSREPRASAGRAWLDLVCDDMEASSYAVGALDLPASCVGAPHIRQRLYFVAERVPDSSTASIEHGGLEDADSQRLEGQRLQLQPRRSRKDLPEAAGRGETGGLAKANENHDDGPRSGPPVIDWRDADWLFCRDGKWRSVEPGTSALDDGVTVRVVRGSDSRGEVDCESSESRTLRIAGYGDAIVAPLAAEFIVAYMRATT